MHRLPLVILAAAVLLPGVSGSTDLDSGHFDPQKLRETCVPCHSGHGVSGTPMLASEGDEACTACHQSMATTPGEQSRLGLRQAANPADILTETTKPSIHRGAQCRDCHSVHGGTILPRSGNRALQLGSQKPSPKRGFPTEAALCLSCHGKQGPRADDPHDLSRLLDPGNLSYHPVLAPTSIAEVPSLKAPLGSDSMINCTDCHTNDDPSGPRGPHGSRVPGLLGADYAQQPGQAESDTSYELCYACHDRQIVLEQDAFPLHRLHVVDQRTPCVLCHDSHGATEARALIRFNEPTALTGVNPSGSGRLGFVSTSQAGGLCFLRCHSKDHDPLGYGDQALLLALGGGTESALEPLTPGLGLGQPGAATSAPLEGLPGELPRIPAREREIPPP